VAAEAKADSQKIAGNETPDLKHSFNKILAIYRRKYLKLPVGRSLKSQKNHVFIPKIQN